MTRRLRQVTNPKCLGQMSKKYCRHCSDRCPNTALCVLVLMGEYLRRDHNSSQESTDVTQFLIIPPLTVPPDEPQQ